MAVTRDCLIWSHFLACVFRDSSWERGVRAVQDVRAVWATLEDSQRTRARGWEWKTREKWGLGSEESRRGEDGGEGGSDGRELRMGRKNGERRRAEKREKGRKDGQRDLSERLSNSFTWPQYLNFNCKISKYKPRIASFSSVKSGNLPIHLSQIQSRKVNI